MVDQLRLPRSRFQSITSARHAEMETERPERTSWELLILGCARRCSKWTPARSDYLLKVSVDQP